MFLDSVGSVTTTVLALPAGIATIAASDTFKSRQRTGRHTVEIVNNGDAPVYLGGSDVTAANGVPIEKGTSRIIPVNGAAADSLYLFSAADASVIIAEYTA